MSAGRWHPAVPPTTPWRHIAPWLGLLAIGVAAALLRLDLVESRAAALRCDATPGLSALVPWWCSIRALLIAGFLSGTFGYAALLAAALALWLRRAGIAWLAAALGLLALQWYCYETGALALLIGCLRYLRWQAFAAHRATPAKPAPGSEPATATPSH